MVRKVKFQKFTSSGNNFLIVDETRRRVLKESEKSTFAYQATNINFGVGADGVLFLQSSASNALEEINAAHGYWKETPIMADTDFIFRLFEPNGAESFSCGNGLMCMAAYLYRHYGVVSTRILTQVPTSEPTVITIGTNTQNMTNWANMGCPQRIPSEIAELSYTTPLDDKINILHDITISFRAQDLHPFSDETSIRLTGYLIFTGEPHLIIFPDSGISAKPLRRTIFAFSDQKAQSKQYAERRIAFGSWLVHHIGTYLNKKYTHIFPAGINVDFVRIPSGADALEYRCFERGIYKETLACGTGALAVSFIARRLNLTREKEITVWPHRCRWYDLDAQNTVIEDNGRWLLFGKPSMLIEGEFIFQNSRFKLPPGVDSEKADQRQNVRPNKHLHYDMALNVYGMNLRTQ